METFIKKFQNVKKELEVSHKVEKNKFEGKHTTGSGIFKTDASIANKLIISARNTNNGAKSMEGKLNQQMTL